MEHYLKGDNVPPCHVCSHLVSLHPSAEFKSCLSLTDELRSLRDEYISASEEEKKFLEKRFGRRVIQKAVEESFSTEWLKDNCKQCPCCGTNIQVSAKNVCMVHY